jgi:glycosyltransferase involved in cell wall biosynthesis
LKILQLVPSLDTGGAERSAIEIAEALTRAGHANWIAAKPGAWSDWAASSGAVLLPIACGAKSWRFVGAFFQLRRAITQIRPDIVHTRSRLPSWLYWCVQKSLPRLKRPRWVTTLHGLHSVSRYSAIQHAGELAITVSETAKSFVRLHYGESAAARLHVIARGADTTKFYPAQNTRYWKEAFYREFPQAIGKRILLLAGRGTRLKGHAQAIHLAAQLCAQTESANVVLFLAGVIESKRSAYLDELRQLSAELGVQDQVVFARSRNDLPALYAECAAVLQLSIRPESFGRTVAEALSCGAPVLGYAHGGVGEQLQQCFPEGACPLGDQDALLERAQAILRGEGQIVHAAIPNLAAMQQATLLAYEQLLAGNAKK